MEVSELCGVKCANNVAVNQQQRVWFNEISE